jgi:nucleotide-binding universal stress UspA family protein
MSTILMATDGSPSAEKATETAIELARAAAWHLHFVTVWSISTGSFGYAPMTYVPYSGESERERGREVLSAAVETARAAGIETTAELRQGTAVQEVCAAAAEVGADLIVMGAHGWGPIKRLVFGSVSTGVLHHAPCPVLVVRGDAARQKAKRELAATVSD